MFEKKNKIQEDLEKKFKGEDCVPVTCADVECVFEFVGYSYRGGLEVIPPHDIVPPLQEDVRSLSRSPLSPAKLKDRRTLPSLEDKDNRTRFMMPKKSNVPLGAVNLQFSLSEESQSPTSSMTTV